MKLREIQKVTNARVLCGEDRLDREVTHANGCDLMSEVLRLADEDMVLLTGLTNIHVLKTAEMAGIQTLVFVWGKTPDEKFIQEADELGMVVMTTDLSMYHCCGVLYENGLGETVRT